MTETSPSPVLDAVVRVATEATRAARGRLLVGDAATPHLEVVAAWGGDAAWRSSLQATGAGVVGYVVATGQPQILFSRDPGAPDAPLLSVLCAPCIRQDDVVGALELAEKAGRDAFSIDDLELASLLASIAGEAIVARPATAAIDPGPLGGDLRRLAAADPIRYETVARLVQSLLRG